MPPPPSPPYATSQHSSSKAPLLPPPVSLEGAPITPSAHRPGSSMSISAMLGSDQDALTRERYIPRSNGPSQAPPTSRGSPTQHPPHAYGRPGSQDRPEPVDTNRRWASDAGVGNRDSSAAPSSWPAQDYPRRSPDVARHRPLFHEAQQYRYPHPEEGPIVREGYSGGLRRSSVGGVERPQEAGHGITLDHAGDARGIRDYRPSSASFEHRMPANAPNHFSNLSPTEINRLRQGAPMQVVDERARRPLDVHPIDGGRPHAAPANGHPAGSAPNVYATTDVRPMPADGPRLKVGDRNVLVPAGDISSAPRARESHPLSREPSNSGPLRPSQDHRHALALALERGENRGRGSPGLASARHPLSAASSGDFGAEESSPHPKVISLVNDSKRGRLSPLPQAVQGAQAKARGPASEPGIKNEFARMFSGIGSGVGSAVSTPAPPETQPPGSFPSSPTRLEDSGRRTPLTLKVDRANGAKPPQRRRRKPKNADIKQEGDAENGPAARGQKRQRQNHAAPLALAQP